MIEKTDRPPKIQIIKCDTPSFEALVAGQKPFELRKNDRDYRVDDILKEEEWNPNTEWTGRTFEMKVTYALYEGYGIPEGYCLMTVVPLRMHKIEYPCRFQSHGEVFCESPGPCAYKRTDIYPDQTFYMCTKPFVPQLDMVKILNKIKNEFDNMSFISTEHGGTTAILMSDAKRVVSDMIKAVEKKQEDLE
jgi:hypothetical protein